MERIGMKIGFIKALWTYWDTGPKTPPRPRCMRRQAFMLPE